MVKTLSAQHQSRYVIPQIPQAQTRLPQKYENTDENAILVMFSKSYSAPAKKIAFENDSAAPPW